MASSQSTRTTVRQNLRDLPPSIWMLCAGAFVNRFGSFVVPFLILYVVHQGYSAAEAGLAASSYGLGSIIAAVAGGAMADGLGRKFTIATSMLGSAVCMLILSQARGLVFLAVLTGLAGLFSELYRPATGALLADLVPPGQRVTAFATYRLAINVGFAVGPATAGFLAGRSYLLLFLGDALTSAAFALVVLLGLPRAPQIVHGDGEGRARFDVILGDRPFLLLLFAYLSVAFVYFQAQSTLPLHVRDSGLSPTVYGLLLSLNGLAIVVIELPLTSITQHLPAHRVIAAGLFLVGAGFALTQFAHSLIALALTVLIWTVGEMMHSSVAQAYISDMSPPQLRGRYQGAFGLTWALGLVLGPAIGTRLFAWNETALWICCGILGVVAAALVLLSAPRESANVPANRTVAGGAVPTQPQCFEGREDRAR